jgi:hypothetical protein
MVKKSHADPVRDASVSPKDIKQNDRSNPTLVGWVNQLRANQAALRLRNLAAGIEPRMHLELGKRAGQS